jgi:hypothetical protein
MHPACPDSELSWTHGIPNRIDKKRKTAYLAHWLLVEFSGVSSYCMV